VHAHGVDVLDEADRDLLLLRVPDDLELQLLPADDRLLDQDLSDQARGEAALGDRAELLGVVDDASPRAAIV